MAHQPLFGCAAAAGASSVGAGAHPPHASSATSVSQVDHEMQQPSPAHRPPRPATGKYPRIILEFRIGTINGGGAAPNDVRLANLDNDRTVSHQLQLARCCCRYLPMYTRISGAFLLVSKKTVRRTTTTLREGLTVCGCLRTFPHGYFATIERGRASAVKGGARSSGWCCCWRCCSTGCGLTCQTNELPSGIWNADLVSGYWAEGSDDKKEKKRKKQIQYRFCDERATAIVAVIDCSHPLEGLSLSAPRVLLLLVFLWATSWHERLAPPPFAVHLHTHTPGLASICASQPLDVSFQCQRTHRRNGRDWQWEANRPISRQQGSCPPSLLGGLFPPWTPPLSHRPSLQTLCSRIRATVSNHHHLGRRGSSRVWCAAGHTEPGARRLRATTGRASSLGLVRVGGSAPAFDFGAGRDKFDKSWRVSTRPAAPGLAGLQ